MTTLDILLVASFALYPLFVAIESRWPARAQPRIRHWRWIGGGFFLAFAAIGVGLPLLLPPAWFEASLLPGSALGVAGGALAGYLATTLVGYAWHRAVHRVPLLWRVFHQLHHAPRRLDAAGALVFHPSEMVFYTLMPLAVTTLLLGLDPLAASIVGLLAMFNAMFQHANVATPRWLGWFVQRPEAHSIHHEHGRHAFNYSDFPLWDRLFGTYREGRGFRLRVGFDERESGRWGSMILMRDVHAVQSDRAAASPQRA